MGVISRRVREINPMFFVAMALLIVTYIILNQKGLIDDNVRLVYIVFFILIVMLAFFSRERQLLTLGEAQEIAMHDARLMQNQGKIRQDGRLLLLEDAVLRRLNKEPDHISVAVGLEGIEPVVIVYAIHPYTGYILRVSKRDFWSAMKDPDIKTVMLPSVLDWAKVKKDLFTDIDVV